MKKSQTDNAAEEASLDLSSVDDAAAVWSETLRESGGDLRVRQAFDNWRERDPAHIQAFDRIEAARSTIEAIADAPELLALRNETLSRVAVQRPHWARNISAIAATVVIGIAAALAYTGHGWRELPGSVYDGMRAAIKGETIYETAIGERLVATLEDGSKLTLNTASRAVVAFEGAQRKVTLERGQALFEVAKNKARPFIVTAGDRRVTALGTAFDVRLTDRMFEVTLIEGRVAVEAAPSPEQAAVPAAEPMQREELVPGQQLVALAAKAPIVRSADVRRVTSWRNGQVIFENDALGGAIDEMNRYARKRVTLADPQLASLKISGAFDTGDTTVFIEALTQYFPIDIQSQTEDAVILAWRE